MLGDCYLLSLYANIPKDKILSIFFPPLPNSNCDQSK